MPLRAQAMMDAVEALLEERGASALSAQAITSHAGVNKALLFYYWGSVDRLVEAALDRFFDRHFEALNAFEPSSTHATPRARIRSVIDRYLTFAEGQSAYIRISQEQIARRGRHFETVQRHLGKLLRWTEALLDGVAPKEGPLAAKHFHLSLSAVVVNYFTYGAALGEEHWGSDPLANDALQERREHVLWIVDQWLNGLGLQ